MLDRLYRRVRSLAASPNAAWWLFIVAFAEASVFPVPVDAMLIPMILANPLRSFRLAAICTTGSVLGALLGWVIGAFLLLRVALPIVHAYHADAMLAQLQARFRDYGVWIILAKGLTPIPFKIVTIAAGAAHFALLPFLGACIVTRGARFFLEAALLRAFGARIEAFIAGRLMLVLVGFLALLIAGVVALKWL